MRVCTSLLVMMLLMLTLVYAEAQTIQKFEYFIDTDPGFGLGLSASPVPAPSVTDFPIAIPTSSLSTGFHRIMARAQDSNGQWTETLFFDFYIVGPAAATGDVVDMEYFLDTDPGFGAGVPVAITAATAVSNVPIDLSVASLAVGFHKIFVRVKNTAGLWSEVQFSSFYVARVVPPANIVKFEYFFDTDPGFDNGTAAPLAPASPTVTDMDIFAVPSSLAQGSHVLYVRAKDSAGNWTAIVSQTFVVTPPSCPAATPSIVNGSGCENTSITLTASGAVANQEYRWYNVSIGGASLSNAATYAPTLAATTTYYVSIYDEVANCEGARVPVTATVTPAPAKPTITAGGPTTFCPGGSVTLSGPAGFVTYFWSDGATTESRTVITAGVITLRVSDVSACKSVASDPVNVSLLTPPAKPAISGGTDICNGKSVTLTAAAGFIYQWSDGETTPSIIVSAESSITLIVKDANGCASASSDLKRVACTNVAPVIAEPTLVIAAGGIVNYDLAQILSDADGNLDLTTLKIVSQPESGAQASIENNENLKIDYEGVTFSGTDHLTVSVCDIDAACNFRELSVLVEEEIVVYNGLSPNGDKKNEILLFKNIDLLPQTRQNKVTIFNRWGDVVFEVDNYDNVNQVFRGVSKSGDSLPSGTYFYRVTFPGGTPGITGYLALKN